MATGDRTGLAETMVVAASSTSVLSIIRRWKRQDDKRIEMHRMIAGNEGTVLSGQSMKMKQGMAGRHYIQHAWLESIEKTYPPIPSALATGARVAGSPSGRMFQRVV